MLKVGLTGGIGCGKTTVSTLFEELGIPVIDADIIAHRLVEKGQPALKALVENFGDEILNAEGFLDRGLLRERVFSDREQKRRLEAILHPLVYAQIDKEAAALESRYCIISIPLLIETGGVEMIDRVLVIDCPEAMQVARVRQRDKIPESQIQAIIAAQVSREERLAVADDVIENSKTPLQLAQQVKKLHNLYFLLSST